MSRKRLWRVLQAATLTVLTVGVATWIVFLVVYAVVDSSRPVCHLVSSHLSKSETRPSGIYGRTIVVKGDDPLLVDFPDGHLDSFWRHVRIITAPPRTQDQAAQAAEYTFGGTCGKGTTQVLATLGQQLTAVHDYQWGPPLNFGR